MSEMHGKFMNGWGPRCVWPRWLCRLTFHRIGKHVPYEPPTREGWEQYGDVAFVAAPTTPEEPE